VSVWSWGGAVCAVEVSGECVTIERSHGPKDVHRHVADGWRVDVVDAEASRSYDLGGNAAADSARAGGPPREHDGAAAPADPHRIPARLIRDAPFPLTYHLGAAHYRRSEQPWEQAGRPAADVSLSATAGELIVDVEVRKDAELAFAPARAENELDNEQPDINGDGIQIHLICPASTDAAGAAPSVWILVPEPDGDAVRVTARAPDALPLRASWRQIRGGYAVRAAISLPCDGGAGCPLRLDVIVNEMPPGRERRRGQLVLSGARGEFVYLRGDRQPAERLVPFVVTDG
jgi:hypothetical protein